MKIPTLDAMMRDNDCQEVVDGVVIGGVSQKEDYGEICNGWQDDGVIYNGHGDPIGVRDYNMSESKEILTDGHGNPIGYNF